MGKRIIFLGDIITKNFLELNEFSSVINLALEENKINMIIGDLNNIVKQLPDKIFILIGINDLLNNTEKVEGNLKIPFIDSYEVIFKVLKINLPETKCYVQAILPINESSLIEKNELYYFNNEINKINSELKELSKNYNTIFLDFNINFKDVLGNLKKEYTNNGISLNRDGYEFYMKLIKPFIIE